MKSKKVKKGLYLVEYKGHKVYIEDCSFALLERYIHGVLRWAIWSDTLNVYGNEGEWDTSYATKWEALERLTDILETSKPW
jgi:hypothetical protein|tara:strand:+ start:930 stop:1172 length:243 start_codon:yes stop_codon:yes gene_type:complete